MKQIFFLIVILIFLISGCKTPEEPFAIHTIGDSTMANKKPEVHPETGWCPVLPEFFDETVTIKNHRVNGRSTKSFIDEGRWKAVLDSLQPGDFVFIQFGHKENPEI